MKGVAEWLASIGLGEYAQRFAENAIDLSVVCDLTEQDLKDLGVLLGHRRKMLRAIAELDGAATRHPPSVRMDNYSGADAMSGVGSCRMTPSSGSQSSSHAARSSERIVSA